MPFRPLWVDAEKAVRSKEPDRGYDALQAWIEDWSRRAAAEDNPFRRKMLELEWILRLPPSAR
jgi:hypothetical protein